MTATAFPKTKTVQADVIAQKGALAVGCRRFEGKIIPALSPLNAVTRKTASSVHMAGFSAATGKFYLHAGTRIYYSLDGLNLTQGVMFTAQAPFMLEERDADKAQMRIVGDTRCVVESAGAANSSLKAYNYAVRGGILKNGRLFAVDLNDGLKVKWSGEGGSCDWVEGISGAGWLYLGGNEGEISELVALNGNIVAVRERGLTVISAYGSPENFKILNVSAHTPQIYGHTAQVYGGKLYFCAEESVYCFDGARVEKCSNSLAEEILTPQYAAVYDGIYYYCGLSKLLERQVIGALDIKSGECYIIDFPAEALAVRDRLFAFSQNQCCSPKVGGDFSFTSGNIDFGTSGKKVLKRVEIYTAEPVDVEVFCDGKIRRFNGVKRVLTANTCGVNFKITVLGKSEIKGIYAYGEIRDGI